jgi:small GTP-binding protein
LPVIQKYIHEGHEEDFFVPFVLLAGNFFLNEALQCTPEGEKHMSDIPLYKIVIAGDESVGKTSLIRRYCEGKFDTSRVATIGVDFQTKVVDLPAGSVKLSIWDLAGQERFQVVRLGMYRGSRAAALVFDLSRPETLEHLAAWRQEAQGAVAAVRFLIVGNKADLAPARGAGKAFADSIQAAYIETSAQTGEGVAEIFESLARLAGG